MQARYLPEISLERILEPEHPLWRGVRHSRLALNGTPLGLQPTAATRASWAGRRIGAIDRVDVGAIHSGSLLAFRLEWADPSENRTIADTTHFVDAAAVLLPAASGAPAVTMGAPGAPVTAWYWRADEGDRGRHIAAQGLGTTRTLDRELVRTGGVWKNGRWHVVIARALRVRASERVAQLEAGQSTGFAVAIWDGNSAERAGLKAFSGDWRPLRLEPVPTAGS